MALNPFDYCTAAELADLRAKYLACIAAISVAGQSYNLNGVSLSRANLDAVTATFAQINLAIRNQDGTALRVARPFFRRRWGGIGVAPYAGGEC